MGLRHAVRRLLAVGVTLAPAVAFAPAAGAAPSITELRAGLGSTANPVHAIAGADGATWFTQFGSPGRIGRLADDGTITTFGTNATLPDNAGPFAMARAADGVLWFTASTNPGRIGSITTSGAILTSTTPTHDSGPSAMTTGPDGRPWFTETSTGMIGRVAADGTLTEFSTGLSNNKPTGITSGPDGALWFVEGVAGGRLGRITTQGQVSFVDLPGSTLIPRAATTGADGALWVAADAGGNGQVLRVTSAGAIIPTSLPAGVSAVALTSGIDGALWLSLGSQDEVGRLTLDGTLTRLAILTGATPRGIAVGPDGNLVVALDAPDGIARVSSPPGLAATPSVDARSTTATLTATVHPARQATSVQVEYGTSTAYGQTSAATSAGAGGAPGNVALGLAGLAPGTTYHARVVATNASGPTRGPDVVLTTAPAAPAAPVPAGAGAGATDPLALELLSPVVPAADAVTPAADAVTPATPLPQLGRSVVVREAAGSVRVQVRGRGAFVDLTSAGEIPVGSVLDTRAGTVALTSVRDRSGATQTGMFSRGVFEVRQSPADAYTELRLRGGSFACPRITARAAGLHATAAAAKRAKVVRSLWGSDDQGRFRTRGRDSVATVRGTRWRTEDRCDGTLTTVTAGAVSVRELRRGGVRRTITAGHRYLARH